MGEKISRTEEVEESLGSPKRIRIGDTQSQGKRIELGKLSRRIGRIQRKHWEGEQDGQRKVTEWIRRWEWGSQKSQRSRKALGKDEGRQRADNQCCGG